jgi:hypothetical protein
MKKYISLILLFTLSFNINAQQVADTTYNPPIKNPIYEHGKGSVVFIDEGHHNFHTKEGRYKAFANLVERDGYDVKRYKGQFKEENLSKGKILVISNALNEINVENWYLPTPSAFSKKEIRIVEKWVKGGGSLFLIADHMPLAGAAKDLAGAFGFEFSNGFVFNTASSKGTAFFKTEDNTLVESSITKGMNDTENVKHIVSFTGQGFKIPSDATPVLKFNSDYVNTLPDTAWVFKDIPRTPVKGWSQGAYKKVGKGRIVVWGEAGMFTAQLAGPEKRKFGMSRDIAKENYQLLLNIIHWLDGKLD